MAGKAKRPGGISKKLKDQQDDNKTLYSLANQGTIIQSNASAISGGSQGGGSWQTTAMSDINMNTYDIRDVDRLLFATKEGAGDALTATDYGMEAIYSSGSAYGLSIRYPAGASQIFQLVKGSDELINISDAFGMSLGTDLLLSGKAISIGQQSTPASPPTNFRKIFVDTDNSNHLTVLKSDGSEVDLEAGGWTGSATSDLDMNTYDIIDVDRLQFTSDSGEGRDNTKVEMYANANTPEDAIINFPDSAVFRWTQNGTFFVAVDEDGIVPRLDDDWSIGTASYQLKDLQTKLWTADQGTIKQYLTMSNTGAGGDHYAYVVGQMTSVYNGAASLGSSTEYGDDYDHYWLRTSTRILDLQSGETTAPTHAGEFRLDGTDVKVYTGGGVKSLSDIGTGGSSGANTALSNLTSSVAVNEDIDPASDLSASLGSSSKRWNQIHTLNLSAGSLSMDGNISMDSNDISEVSDLNNTGGGNGTFAWEGSGTAQFSCNITALYSGNTYIGNSSSDNCIIDAKVDFTDNTGSSGASSAGTYNGNILSPDGYIEIKIGGTNKTIPYYST